MMIRQCYNDMLPKSKEVRLYKYGIAEISPEAAYTKQLICSKKGQM